MCDSDASFWKYSHLKFVMNFWTSWCSTIEFQLSKLWNQLILTVVVLLWILQVWYIKIHLWVTSWESYDKIHCIIILNCYIIFIRLKLSMLWIDLICHIHLSISILKVSVGVFCDWLFCLFYFNNNMFQ